MEIILYAIWPYKGILQNSGCGLPFPSYGPIFSDKVSKVSELFSEMKTSIDLGFFAESRYMLIVIGKIEKCAQACF